MAMNSGGAVNLATNIAAAVAVLWVLALVARPVLSSTDGRSILEFRGWGFAVLCGYLLLLYTLTYFHLRAEARPSVPVQLATFLFYALAIAGLWLHRRRDPDPKAPVSVEDREKRLAIGIFAVLTALALVLTAFAKHKAVLSVIMVNFMIWTPLGMLLTLLSLVRGLRERLRSGS
jgi:amino acid transporter